MIIGAKEAVKFTDFCTAVRKLVTNLTREEQTKTRFVVFR